MSHESSPAEHRFWAHVREQFFLDHPRINLAAMSMAPHSRAVRRAIDYYAEELDRAGWPYLSSVLTDSEQRIRAAAADYFFPENGDNIALTDGTLQGLSLMYAGIRIAPDQHILTSNHEFSHVYTMFDSRQERERPGQALIRSIDLFTELPKFCEKDVLGAIDDAIDEHTRVLALTWVYSNTGVKLPIGKIGQRVRDRNKGVSPERRLLFCVDGVHGFGVEDATFPELQCDFFVSGCHKWIFGPRGTGVWLGTEDSWKQMLPIIPSTTGASKPGFANTPGGLHSYELRWALDQAFELLDRRIGKRAVQERVHGMATRVKKALLTMKHVSLITPESPEFSAGIICFDVRDKSGVTIPAGTAVAALEKAGIVATSSSLNRAQPDVRHVRLSVSILNSDDEIERALDAIANLG